jgi:DNA helicase HerA-like ATPase
VGDPDKPKLVFFFDEAHLLFDDAPKALVDKVEQVARLIRSKGVGVYFVTQNPADVPEDILGQLGNRVQHALRAFTGKDQQDLQARRAELPHEPRLRHRGRDPRGRHRGGRDLHAGEERACRAWPSAR